MKTKIVKLWVDIRSSYWFFPSVLATAGCILAPAVVWVDVALGPEWIEELLWLSPDQPEGARSLLSTVAGSMITVAGVTFSMTLLAVSHTGTQLGPRILNNLLRDRGNQVTLGIFIATFLYCLIVLRALRAGDRPFVPHLAVLLALGLAFVSVAVLIYFIHHVPQTIHATDVVARVGRRLRESIDSTRSDEETERQTREALRADARALMQGLPLRVAARETGYIQLVDHRRLVGVASKKDCLAEVVAGPGEFVHEGTTLLEAWPRSGHLDEGIDESFRQSFAIGIRRALPQDVLFPADQLVEVAIRALSPGVNDPFTALECIDQLTAGAVSLARRHDPLPYAFDSDGVLRLLFPTVGFESFVRRVFARLRPHAGRDRMAALRLMGAVERVLAQTTSADRRLVLRREARALLTTVSRHLDRPDRDDVRRVFEGLFGPHDSGEGSRMERSG